MAAIATLAALAAASVPGIAGAQPPRASCETTADMRSPTDPFVPCRRDVIVEDRGYDRAPL